MGSFPTAEAEAEEGDADEVDDDQREVEGVEVCRRRSGKHECEFIACDGFAIKCSCPVKLTRDLADEVAHLLALGLQVALVGGFGGYLGGDTLYNLDACQSECFDLFRIVGDKADLREAKLLENLSGKLELAAVGFIAKLKIGLDGVESLVLKFVSAEFGHEADASAFLLLVEEDTCTCICNGAEGELELLAAVAAKRVEDVAGEALRVDAHDRRGTVNVSHDEGHGRFDASSWGRYVVVAALWIIDNTFEAKNPEVSPAGWENRRRLPCELRRTA